MRRGFVFILYRLHHQFENQKEERDYEKMVRHVDKTQNS